MKAGQGEGSDPVMPGSVMELVPVVLVPVLDRSCHGW